MENAVKSENQAEIVRPKRGLFYAILAIMVLSSAVSFYFFLLNPAKTEYALMEKNNFAIATNASSSEPVVTKREKPAKLVVKGIYLTAYSAGSPKKVDSIIASIKNSSVNAVVIDIKDYTGYLAYDSKLPIVARYGLKEIKIKDVPGVIKKFHDAGVYVIARIAVFQDPALSRKKPEWAVLNNVTGGIWTDRKGLSWLDPANPEVWKYHVDISKEAVEMGFDEINLDYIRFPSDGTMSTMKFPKWKEGTKSDVMERFFAYYGKAMKDEPAYISADLFGLTTTVYNDMNIGQLLEDAAPYFHYICPMVYPSHYPAGYLGFKNPAAYPYEVVYRATKVANQRLATTTDSMAEIRPWIQDFNMGATYTADMIKKQIRGNEDAGGIAGWTAWDPKNIYTWAAYK